MPSRKSFYARYPEHRVAVEPSANRVRVRLDNQVVADSLQALVVRETNHDPVAYFPREDVRFAFFERTDHRTFCPFKGDASYWTVRAGERVEENVAWTYEDTFDEVADLRGYVAFFQDRVDCEDPPPAHNASPTGSPRLPETRG